MDHSPENRLVFFSGPETPSRAENEASEKNSKSQAFEKQIADSAATAKQRAEQRAKLQSTEKEDRANEQTQVKTLEAQIRGTPNAPTAGSPERGELPPDFEYALQRRLGRRMWQDSNILFIRDHISVQRVPGERHAFRLLTTWDAAPRRVVVIGTIRPGGNARTFANADQFAETSERLIDEFLAECRRNRFDTYFYVHYPDAAPSIAPLELNGR